MEKKRKLFVIAYDACKIYANITKTTAATAAAPTSAVAAATTTIITK